MSTPLSPSGGSHPTFADHLDLMFGTRERLVKDEPHVKVWRCAAGGARYFRKQYLRFRDERNRDIDLSFWTDREEQVLAALNAPKLGLGHVQVFKSRSQSADRSQRQLETWDAGPDGDQWQQVPVARDGHRLAHPFMECGHWFGLGRWLLAALEEVHALGFVHVDLKGDNFCLPARSDGVAADGYPERVRLAWDELKLIDFAFSVWEKGLPPLYNDTPLPIGRSEFRYQSEQLLAALEAGNSPAPDLGPTRGLDWRVDLYSLGFVLGQILAEVERRCFPEDGNWGWTERRHAQARQLIENLQSGDREWRRPPPAERPHRALIGLLDRLLGEDDLAASLARDWEIKRDPNWHPQDASVRTPPTAVAPKRRGTGPAPKSASPPSSPPLKKGGEGGFRTDDGAENPPRPPFSKGGSAGLWTVILAAALGAGAYAVWKEGQRPPPAPRPDPTPPPVAATPAEPRAYLTVRATPATAQVRIMNIGPAYRDGIELAPGDFDIQVSAPGYQTDRRWYTVAAGTREVTVALQPTAPDRSAFQVFQDPLNDGTRGPAMVVIPAGEFWMGSPESEAGREPSEAKEQRHRVRIEQAFALGQREVTVGEFRRFADATGYQTDAERDAKNGCYAWNAKDNKWDWRAGLSWRNSGYKQTDNHPVVCVSWNDANRYVEWLSKQTGQSYRLPREAEWEYAARAGMTSARYWGEDPDQACGYANGADRTAKQTFSDWAIHDCTDGYLYTAPVGSFKPNAWKLYDMLGNVWEWTCSAYEKDYNGAEQRCDNEDTTGPRVLRGGAWDDEPEWLRSAARYWNYPRYRYNDAGFRLARTL